MTDFSTRQFPILFRERSTTTRLADAIRGIDVVALCGEYDRLRKTAPSRSAHNKSYFVGHDGRLQTRKPGIRSEEHLAIALWRLDARWPQGGGEQMRLLDYQFPLKASRSDAGLGKVDLLGVTDRGRLAVVELKVRRKDGSRGDTPLLALMEGLRYAAVVHANHRAIAAEARSRFAIDVPDEPPIMQFLAPEDWWRGWCDMTPRTRRAAGEWEAGFVELVAQLEARLGIVIECVSLEGAGSNEVTWDAHGPRLDRTPSMRRARLDDAPAPAPAMHGGAARGKVDYNDYETVLLGQLWGWADRHHANELDGGTRTGRPPVLRPECASKAVLVPSDPAKASGVLGAVPEWERHTWFRSFRSSQSLAQSVFGAVRSFGRLDLLDDVVTECDQPAFLEDTRSASLVLEHKVRSLREPRQTSVDVLLEAGSKRVAVECKFTEREFGVCPRP